MLVRARIEHMIEAMKLATRVFLEKALIEDLDRIVCIVAVPFIPLLVGFKKRTQ